MTDSLSKRLLEALPVLLLRLGFLAAAALGAAGILIAFGATWNTASEWILRICIPIGIILTVVWGMRIVRDE